MRRLLSCCRSGNVQTPDVQYLNCPAVNANPAYFTRAFALKVITTDARFFDYQVSRLHDEAHFCKPLILAWRQQ